ncbi:MAG: TonB-dependent receptor plug domain-containing protein [Bacteroidia bacterium]
MTKVKHTYFALCIFLVLCSSLYAQQKKDTVQLDEVKIIDYRSKVVSENFQEIRLDSSTRNIFSNSSMQQMLMQQNGSFVKSYGPGNISFLSIRGSSAQQTAVVWNGLNINNPMIGQTDLSLLPVSFFNSVSLQKGALSGYWGSGAMAGVLNLQSDAGKNAPLTVNASTSYSSLQNSTNWASANYAAGKWSGATRVFTDVSKNQYNYLKQDSTIAKQTHALSKQIAFMQDANYSINSKQQIGLHLWLQDAQRQIPYTLSEIKQNAYQYDEIFRVMADHKLTQKRLSLASRIAMFNEGLIYKNETYNTSSNSAFKTFMADVETQFTLTGNIKFMAGNTNSVSFANTQGYGSGLYRISRYALYENISIDGKMGKMLAYFRQEIFNASKPVHTMGLSETINIYKWIAWKLNLGTIYRYPTLNDLYWNPGGNKNLKPEHGLSGETSLQLNPHFRKFALSLNATWFSREIFDCIIWLPAKGGNWSPQNVQQVWSRGCETNSGISFNGKNLKTSINVITNYVLSTRKQTLLANDESADKQMPYVPMYSGSSVFSLEYKKWMLRIAYTYTGYRYLSSDNYSYLTPFAVLDARLARTFTVKNILLNVFAEGNNLLNENYQAYAQYPMPLRNFKAGIILQYQKQNKKQ